MLVKSLKYNAVDDKGRYIAGTDYKDISSYNADIELLKNIFNKEIKTKFSIDKTENNFEKGYCIFVTNNKYLCEKLAENLKTKIDLNNIQSSFEVFIKEVLIS